MKTIEFGGELNNKICLALGFFDGVHYGHRKILETTLAHASECGVSAAVFTFADKPNKSDSLLTYNDRKKLFEKMGMEFCISMYFIKDGGKTGEDFFKYLIAKYNISELVCGADYRFGCDHADVGALEKLCKTKHIKLTVVGLCDIGGVRVSSTAIKLLLTEGKLATANKMLVTPYHVSGRVVSGQGIGRNIGMPTVNINRPAGLIPLRQGVYGTKVEVGGKEYLSVTNYGTKPTFDMPVFAIESHLIGYEGESLLGHDITVYFIKYLRSIKKFKSAEELVKQVDIDKGWVEKC